MAEYEQKYLLNKSEQQTTVNNKQKVVPNIELASLEVTEFMLTGMTYDSNVRPFGGVRVVVYDSNGNPKAEAVSSTDEATLGAYTIVFGGTIGETYKIVASKEGFYDASDEVSFSTKATSRSFKLLTDTSIKTIYGTVKDENGAGVGNAAVVVTLGAEEIVVVFTESDGSFIAYDNFAEGAIYTISANLLGYSRASSQVAFAQDESIVRINLVISPQGINYTNITGTIVAVGTTSGIADAFVGLYTVRNGAEELIRTTKTNEIGNYSFTGVPGGETYIVRSLKIDPV